MANNSISLVNLDFDTLKTQLKTYLKGQAQFSDYDFDGSNMSVLLDILTYNTHLNAFYLNMVASEMFLDSAQLRNSVISIAKALNYTPRSTKSAKAVINAVFPQSGLQQFTIPKNTRFTGKNSNGSFTFLTTSATVLNPSNGSFTAANLEIYEGVLTTEAFVVDYSIEGQRFILSNENIDTDSIEVSVTEGSGSNSISYSKSTSLVGMQSNTASYFLQATETTRYEISFGDGVFGRKPKDGAVVSAVYRVTAGPRGNDSTDFNLNDNLGAFNGYGSSILPRITVVQKGYGGATAESLDEIKYRAPKAYQTQDRAVTVNDFSTLITQEFQNIKGVNVYGGEKVIGAPRYGTVYIVPVTFTGENLSDFEKKDIEDFVRNRTIIGLSPIVTDPDYIYVNVATVARYNPDRTTLSAGDIAALIKNAIIDYNDQQLINFDSRLNLSRLEEAINSADPSVSSNNTELTLKKVIPIELNRTALPTVDLFNPIIPGTIVSAEFVAGGRVLQYVDYNPENNTLTVEIINGETVIVNTTNKIFLKDVTNPSATTYTEAGTIDYSTGRIEMNLIEITDLFGSPGLEIMAKPAEPDIVSGLNNIITVNVSTGITVETRKT
jgi:hypothetical protein